MDQAPRPDPVDSGWQTYKRLLAYVKPFWLAFLLAAFGNVIYAAASTGMAAAMEYVITALENPTEENRLLLTGLIVGVFAMRGVGFFLSQYYINYVGRNVINALRRQVFERLLTLPSRYFDENASGRLVSKLTFNVEQVAAAAMGRVGGAEVDFVGADVTLHSIGIWKKTERQPVGRDIGHFGHVLHRPDGFRPDGEWLRWVRGNRGSDRFGPDTGHDPVRQCRTTGP
jgi:ABC-type multidrug transport system fused ATPase/permease subunit